MDSEFTPPPPPAQVPPPAPPSSPPPTYPSAPTYPAAGSYPPYAPPPPRARRLMRSTHERMWAGVAGGMAEYFDIDPALMRLMWVAATIVSGGLAVPVYILAWIILPRDDRPPAPGAHVWRDWSDEFHSETQRLADEARRMADDVRGAGQSWRGQPSGGSEPTGIHDPATDKGGPTPSGASAPPDDAWWQSQHYVERQPNRGRHPRSAGIVLVVLGVLLLAANAGMFSWIEWRTMWPLIFIGFGVLLLGRQSGWGR